MEQSLKAKLFDRYAKEVMDLSSDKIFTEGLNQIAVDVSSLYEGTYLLTIDGQPYMLNHVLVIKE
jgi:hypothetical protein